VAEVDLIENPAELDWAGLHALVHRAYAYMDARIDPPSSLHGQSVDDFRQKANSESLIIAVQSSTIVGCMFCRPQGRWLYVGKVAVEETLQGQGIGRRLFDHAFGMARRAGCRGLELESRIELVENHQAFGNLGFVKIEENAHDGYDQPTSIRMRAEF
jgi:GNAT superfamily N-acetyltransferase